MSARKRYAGEFKIEAVKLVTERGLSQKQVARDLGLDVTTLRRWFKECGTDAERTFPGHSQPWDEELARLRREAANLLQRDFTAPQVNAKWAADITYIDTGEGWLYLAVVLDLYSRRVVGWALQPTLERRLVLVAQAMAIQQRRPTAPLLHHSDRGSQYASEDYQAQLAAVGLQCSMSRRGDCFNNAPVESFFGTLKTELVSQQRFTTRSAARQAIFEHIEVFPNRQ